VPGYELQLSSAPAGGRLVAEARVRERLTGAVETVSVTGERAPGRPPVCGAGMSDFSLRDLFGVQRERLLETLAREAAAAQRAALAGVRPLLAAVLDGAIAPSPGLALLLGWEGAEAIGSALEAGTAPLSGVVAEATALRHRGARFPQDWLARRIARALEARLAALPAAAAEALAILDVAEAAGVTLDLARAQVVTLAWWQTSPPTLHGGAPLRTLCERLALAPEET
jgi:hypothetical protein